MGYGPVTGRGLGPCGAGMRHGWHHWGGAGCRRFISPKNEMSALEEEEQMLEQELQAVKEEKAALQKQQK